MLKQLLWGVVATTILFCATLFFPQVVFAEEQPAIVVSPSIEKLSLRAGERHEGNLTVWNMGNDAIRFKSYVAPYSVNANGDPSFDTENETTELSKWFTFHQFEGDFYRELNAGDNKVFDYIIKVPPCAKDGMQRAIVFFEISEMEGASGQIISRIGSAFSVDITSDTEKCKIEEPDGGVLEYKVAFIIGGGAVLVVVVGLVALIVRKNNF